MRGGEAACRPPTGALQVGTRGRDPAKKLAAAAHESHTDVPAGPGAARTVDGVGPVGPDGATAVEAAWLDVATSSAVATSRAAAVEGRPCGTASTHRRAVAREAAKSADAAAGGACAAEVSATASIPSSSASSANAM